MHIDFVWTRYPNSVNWIIGLVVILLLFLICFYLFIKVVKRTSGYVFLGVSLFWSIICYIFCLDYPLTFTAVIVAVGIALFFFANLGDLRTFIASPFRRANVKPANFGVEKIYDSSELYKTIDSAVQTLSKNKIGAIITFERNTSLKEIIKNGVPIHAPVSAELLLTIFYPGTRLHDGAVVIHGNEIVAASVFYTPSTLAFTGKYGSRHRAAIGISEVSDAITVVVSEETGRISFAINGTLDTVEPDSFLRSLENYMGESSAD